MVGNIGLIIRSVPEELRHKQARGWLVRGEFFALNLDTLFCIVKMLGVFIFKRGTS